MTKKKRKKKEIGSSEPVAGQTGIFVHAAADQHDRKRGGRKKRLWGKEGRSEDAATPLSLLNKVKKKEDGEARQLASRAAQQERRKTRKGEADRTGNFRQFLPIRRGEEGERSEEKKKRCSIKLPHGMRFTEKQEKGARSCASRINLSKNTTGGKENRKKGGKRS